MLPSYIDSIHDHLRLTVTPGLGQHSIEYWSTDREGNVEQHRTETFTLTDLAPAVLVSDVQRSYSGTTSADIRLLETTPGWAGLVVIRCSADGLRPVDAAVSLARRAA